MKKKTLLQILLLIFLLICCTFGFARVLGYSIGFIICSVCFLAILSPFALIAWILYLVGLSIFRLFVPEKTVENLKDNPEALREYLYCEEHDVMRYYCGCGVLKKI
jgi:hypothetical protein